MGESIESRATGQFVIVKRSWSGLPTALYKLSTLHYITQECKLRLTLAMLLWFVTLNF